MTSLFDQRNAPLATITPFSFEGFSVRTIQIDGQPWFVAADVCDALGLENTSQAVKGRADRGNQDGLDSEEQGVATVTTPSGDQQMLVVNESGLYSLTFKSRKPEAKRFKRWVTSEVLPSIRKTGSYGIQTAPAAPATLSRMDILKLAMESEQRALEAEEQLKLAAPAIAHLEAVQSSKDDFTFQEMAHVLQEHGYRLGRNRLMDILRRAGVLAKTSNLPMQDYRERGYFRVVESIRESATGRKHVDLTTYVTGKGHNWLTKAMDALLLKSEKIGGAA